MPLARFVPDQKHVLKTTPARALPYLASAMIWKMRVMTLPIFMRLLHETVRKWWSDEAPHLGAALAFYASLSIAPLLLLGVSLLGSVMGRDAAQGQLLNQVAELIGEEGGHALEAMVKSASQRPDAGFLATTASIVTLLFSATGVFAELQDALNKMWKARPPGPVTLSRILRGRLFSFGMIVVIAFLLLVSLIISTSLAATAKYVSTTIPGYPTILQITNGIVSFMVITVLFALIFKVLPDTHVAWGNVWVGAALTSALFSIGKLLIGLYLGRSAVTSAYGAAGSLVILLLWVYFSSQILFFGAEFTYIYSKHHLLEGEQTTEPVVTDPAEIVNYRKGHGHPETEG